MAEWMPNYAADTVVFPIDEPRALQRFADIEHDRRESDYRRLVRCVAKAITAAERRASGW